MVAFIKGTFFQEPRHVLWIKVYAIQSLSNILCCMTFWTTHILFTHLHTLSQWPPFHCCRSPVSSGTFFTWKAETWTLQRSSDPNTFISFTVMRTWQSCSKLTCSVFFSFNILHLWLKSFISIFDWIHLNMIECWLSLSSSHPGAKYISFEQVVPNPDSDDFREMDHLADCDSFLPRLNPFRTFSVDSYKTPSYLLAKLLPFTVNLQSHKLLPCSHPVVSTAHCKSGTLLSELQKKKSRL